jgi:hypothetical protein
MKPKKLKFNKRKKKPHPHQKAFDAIDAIIVGKAMSRALAAVADAYHGRYNVQGLFTDQQRDQAFEAGFVGFKVQIPWPKPNPFQFVSMQGRQMGREHFLSQLYGEGNGPESVISYQERVRRHRLDRTTEFNPGADVVNDSPIAASCINQQIAENTYPPIVFGDQKPNNNIFGNPNPWVNNVIGSINDQKMLDHMRAGERVKNRTQLASPDNEKNHTPLEKRLQEIRAKQDAQEDQDQTQV